MAILCINLSRVEASNSRIEKFSGELTVNSTPLIKSIEEIGIEKIGISNALTADFEFTTMYEPKLGQIKLWGEVIFTDINSKKIADDWKKTKKVPNEVGVPLLNAIFRKCLGKSIVIAEDPQLPPPVVFPTVIPTDMIKDAREKEGKDKKK